MKITHIISSLESSQGGPPNSVLNMAEYQSKLGNKVKVVSQLKNLDKKKKLKGIKIDAKEISVTRSLKIMDENNTIIGELRSACYSPHFKQVIGIAMINKPYWEDKQTVKIDINDQTFEGKVCDLPFI